MGEAIRTSYRGNEVESMSALRSAGMALLGIAAVAAAQVPVTSEPRHRLVFENTEFRVLDVNVPPGDITLMHSHDRDIVTVSMNAGADTRAQSPGQPWSEVRPRRSAGHAAITEYAGSPASHRVENVGATPYQLFAVENVRTGGWSSTAALAARATAPLLESRAFRVYDVRLTGDTSQTFHAHDVPTIAVLISGMVMSAGSDRHLEAGSSAPVGLKLLDAPGQWVLVPQGDSHHLTRLGADDSHLVEVEIR
jgi:hypothetical protein